jgi:hypothetical protein
MKRSYSTRKPTRSPLFSPIRQSSYLSYNNHPHQESPIRHSSPRGSSFHPQIKTPFGPLRYNLRNIHGLQESKTPSSFIGDVLPAHLLHQCLPPLHRTSCTGSSLVLEPFPGGEVRAFHTTTLMSINYYYSPRPCCLMRSIQSGVSSMLHRCLFRVTGCDVNDAPSNTSPVPYVDSNKDYCRAFLSDMCMNTNTIAACSYSSIVPTTETDSLGALHINGLVLGGNEAGYKNEERRPSHFSCSTSFCIKQEGSGLVAVAISLSFF